jgi:sugar phosphate isomerase/epimerase
MAEAKVSRHALSLEYLTLFGVSPPELIDVAADAGYQHVSIVADVSAIDPAYEPLSVVSDVALRRATAERMKQTGITISVGEGLMIKPGMEVQRYRPTLEAFASLGIPRINTICFEPDLSLGLQQLAALCGLAREQGIEVTLEFTPLSRVKSLGDAVDALAAVDQPNLKIMLDSLHLARSDGTPSDVARIDPTLIGYAQISDGPAAYPGDEMYFHEALFERLLPGDGELPLIEFIQVLPPGIILGAEVRLHSQALAGVSASTRAKRVIDAVRTLASSAAHGI